MSEALDGLWVRVDDMAKLVEAEHVVGYGYQEISKVLELQVQINRMVQGRLAQLQEVSHAPVDVGAAVQQQLAKFGTELVSENVRLREDLADIANALGITGALPARDIRTYVLGEIAGVYRSLDVAGEKLREARDDLIVSWRVNLVRMAIAKLESMMMGDCDQELRGDLEQVLALLGNSIKELVVGSVRPLDPAKVRELQEDYHRIGYNSGVTAAANLVADEFHSHVMVDHDQSVGWSDLQMAILKLKKEEA